MKRIILFFAALLTLASINAFSQDNEADILNKKNLTIKEWNTDVKTHAKWLDHLTVYNSDGRKIEEIEYTPKGQKWRERFEYGTSDKVVRELVYDEHNKLSLIRRYEYNEYGKKKAQYNYNSAGKLTGTKAFEYIVTATK